VFKLFEWLKVANSRGVRNLAFESAKVYYKNKNFTSEQFQGYQRGFVNSYTSAYIRDKIQ
jgi:hypothetical protein